MTETQDDTTYSYGIELDAEEQALGVVDGRYIRWKDSAAYIYELASGGSVFGFCSRRVGVLYDHEIGRSIARRNGLEQIRKLRAKGKLAPVLPRSCASTNEEASQ